MVCDERMKEEIIPGPSVEHTCFFWLFGELISRPQLGAY